MSDAPPSAEQKYRCTRCGGSGYEPAVGDVPSSKERRHTTVVETGTIAGILFMVFGVIGFFCGVFIFGLAQWELAKEIGRTQAIGIINQSHLEACSTMLRSDRDLNEIQRSYCADTIDAALGVVEWRTDK